MQDRDLTAAARREVYEETGFEKLVAIRNAGHTFRFKKGSRDVVEHLFGIELTGALPVRLSREHVDYAWLTPDEGFDRLTWEINREGLRRVLELAI